MHVFHNNGKKVRIIKESDGIKDAERFVGDIVYPVNFKSLEMKDGEFILTAGSHSKASLIGRNKRRLIELQQIVSDCFGLNIKIV